MIVHRLAIASPILALCSIALTLLVWAWILAQPPGSFHDQGGLTITLICFPLCMLGWITAGVAAVALGVVSLAIRTGNEPRRATTCLALAGITLGLLALPLAIATLAIA